MKQKIVITAIVILFVILGLFQAIPLTYGSTSSYISQANTQLTRSNGFAKDALLLEYGSTEQKTQALSDIQVTLPLFIEQQNRLQRNTDSNVQVILQEATSSYLGLISSISVVKNEVDPKEIDVVIQNSRSYNVSMGKYLTLLNNQVLEFNSRLVWIQEGILLTIGVLVFWERRKWREHIQ